MLVLEIEFLRGVAVLATNPANAAPDWPPHPDRIFSALVASWGARGERDEERAALEWLERQAPPRAETCEHNPRDTVTVYVPVNDTVGEVMPTPEARPRQPRRFPTARLAETKAGEAEMARHVLVTWDAKPDDRTLSALAALASDTSYIGHSSSLVRCCFRRGADEEARPEDWSELERPRAPYQGRLEELQRIHERHVAGDERARAKASTRTRSTAAAAAVSPQSVFSPDWIVLSHVEGERPDPFATAAIAKAMRNALMAAWPVQPPPTWLSGHEPDRSPARDPHLAIVPLMDVGHEYADGHLMGLALIPPREIAKGWTADTPQAWEDKRALPAALAKLAKQHDGEAIKLTLGRAGSWDVAVDAARVARGLRPERYCRKARRFATVTPIALDRHPKGNHIERSEEAKALVVQACTRIGVPEPASVALFKHATPRGAPSTRPPGGAPAWATWARPGALAGKALAHAVIEFEELIEGPVILGAGRFFGLGLCLPLGDAP
jgi:CRISPR-associated protein Csb2